MGDKADRLRELYDFVDSVPLTRAKKNFGRDFSDGVLTAELIHHECPRIIELHNYSNAHSIPQKLYNWETLNAKVFKHHLNFSVPKSQLQDISSCKAGAVEDLLLVLRQKLEEHKNNPAKDWTPSTHASRLPTKVQGLQLQREPPQGRTDTGSVDKAMSELQDTNKLLTLKIEKLEELLELKNAKIESLMSKLDRSEPAGKELHESCQ